ncbi:cuticle protein 14-like [Uloborus diversus]|uniref:cuticle protein 14-like n=1 Tax=Uloborus diversus TaxID=327109 RepID=UPI0024095B1D|nr:cuticle protein 14-like [Uloborus diversus]XP_054721794.1 cuticle protein 14-like [Uloborus diversus]
MQVLVLFALFAASQAAVLFSAAPLLSTGASSQYRSQDSVGNYHFGYDEGHSSGGSFRKESGDAFGNKVGSYGLRDADGRARIVNYVADAAGFRADVQSNEPGVEPKDPANTSINKAIIAAPAVATYAVAPAAAISYAPFAHFGGFAFPGHYAYPAHYGYHW